MAKQRWMAQSMLPFVSYYPKKIDTLPLLSAVYGSNDLRG
jgi:hypothetical protein